MRYPKLIISKPASFLTPMEFIYKARMLSIGVVRAERYEEPGAYQQEGM
jgi:hypothetical protein